MLPASSPLIALWATGSFVECDLYTITLTGGGTYYLTTADADVVVAAVTWAARGPRIDDSGATIHWKTGVDVDTFTFAVVPRAVDPFTGTAWPDKIGSQSWAAAAASGVFDGAEIQVDTAYWAAWPQPWTTPLSAPVGVVTSVFAGRVAGVEPVRGLILITVNSHLELLHTLMPRNVFQAGCRHTLFDVGCALSAAAFAVDGTASADSDGATVVSAVGAPSGSGSYVLGQIVMTSGANAGARRMIKAKSGTTITLAAPLRFAVTAGDAFTAYPGCDKTVATCTEFANLINFGGFPDIPDPSAAI